MTAQTLQQLLSTLERVEQALYDGEDFEPEDLVVACQNFQRAGQNFDDPGVTGQGTDAVISREVLAGIGERLVRVMSAVELTQESIRDELAGLASGRRALRGYRSIQSISSAQYVSRAC